MRFTITARIALGVAVILFIGIVSMMVIFNALTTVRKSLAEITDVEEPTSAAAYEMEINMIGTGLATVNYLNTGEARFRQRVEKDRADFNKFKAQYDRAAGTQKEKELGDRIAVLYQEFTAAGDVLIKKRDGGETALFTTGEFERFIALRYEMDNVLDEEIQTLTRNDLNASLKRADQAYSHVVRLIAILLPLFIIFSIGASLLMVRTITKPVKNLMKGTEAIGQGDLDYRITHQGGDDEFADLAVKFNQMAAQLETTTVSAERLEASENRLQKANADLSLEIEQRQSAEEERARLQEEIISMQAALLEELSTPLIPLSHEIVLLPLVGTVDSARAAQVLDTLSKGVVTRKARVAIVDITGVPTADTHVTSTLMRAAQAVRLLGAEVVLTGIRPRVAQAFVGLGVDFSNLVTRSTLQGGIAYASEHLRQAETIAV